MEDGHLYADLNQNTGINYHPDKGTVVLITVRA